MELAEIKMQIIFDFSECAMCSGKNRKRHTGDRVEFESMSPEHRSCAQQWHCNWDNSPMVGVLCASALRRQRSWALAVGMRATNANARCTAKNAVLQIWRFSARFLWRCAGVFGDLCELARTLPCACVMCTTYVLYCIFRI